MRWGMDAFSEGIGGESHARTGRCSTQHVKRAVPWVLAVVWTVVLLFWTCQSSAQLKHDFESVANDLASQLAQQFPPLQGVVVDVQGEQLYLSLGARDQVLEGMRLDVFRVGEALTSPTTGEVVARLEVDLGMVTVTRVVETYAVAVPVAQAASDTVQAGDMVRITAGRLPLALLPVTDETGRAMSLAGLADEVQRGLGATGRFHVVPRARLAVWLLERGKSPGDVLTPEVMDDAASALGVAYIVQPLLREVGDSTVVELRMFSDLQPQTPVTTALAMIPELPAIRQRLAPAAHSVVESPVDISDPAVRPRSPPPDAVSTPPVKTGGLAALQGLLDADPVAMEERYVPLAQFPSELRGFDTADIDGDGQTELVMVNGTRVSLYHVHENRLAPIASYSDRRPGILLSAQLVSFNVEERPGVVVNRYSPNRKIMDSFFLVLQGRKLVLHQKGLSDILLAVDTNGDGLNDSIWGQRFDGVNFFRRGQVRQYELRRGRLRRLRKLAMPRGFRATGAALAQFAPTGNRQLIFVDERRNLQVYDGKARWWRSATNVGGSYVFAALDVVTSSGVSGITQFDFEAIPAVADIDGDGIDEVLLPQNQGRLGLVPNLNLYRDGHVVMMRQTPQGFTLSPVSPGFGGVVSGVAVLKGRVRGILVAVSKREGVLNRNKRTTLYLSRL